MKLIQTIKNIFHQDIDNFPPGKNEVVSNHKEHINQDMQQREQDMFGTDRLQQQKLYEKWVVKETWLLKNEAIPLLSGINPESVSEVDLSKQNDLWEHAQHCVTQKLLPVIEPDMEPENWRVRPQDVYKWAAISRIALPETLSTLMEFVLSVVKNTDSGSTPNKKKYADGDDLHDSDTDRESILGASLAILAAYPEKCRNEKGQVEANKIIEILEDKGEFWFGECMPTLSDKARHELINRWLKTVC